MTTNSPVNCLVPIFIATVAIVVGFFIASLPPGVNLPIVPDNSPTKSLPPWIVFSPRKLLHEFFQTGLRATTDPKQLVMDLATSYHKSEVVYMLVHHEIIDVIDGSKSCHDVATSLELKTHVVCQYLKAGSQLGLFTIDGNGVIALTASGAFLQSNHKDTLRNVALFLNEETRDAWRAASTQSAKTGKSGWEEAFDVGFVMWFETYRDKADLMRQAQSTNREIEAGAILGDWKPPKLDAVFCDIGGGVGDTLVSILEHYPNMTGIVVDKTYLSLNAVLLFKEHNLSQRATFLGGYFFAPTLPKLLADCDVFLLKHVLSEFDDENSLVILEKVKAVAKSGAKVVIAERIMETNSFETEKSLASVSMLACSEYGAKDRTLGDFKALLSAAGYVSQPTFIPLRGVISILEVTV
ncbi:O-methyltransferase [Fragilaria crotonensis]|nr:O-methyltransferase [Fragilaria crotonensis]